MACRLDFLTLIIAGVVLNEAGAFPQSASTKRCRSGKVYYEETEKCYREGIQGPCNALMVMTKIEDSNLGECACKKVDICSADRMLGYWEETDRCYYAFDQGPCPDGKWLVPIEGKNKVRCERIPCPDLYEDQDSAPEDLATEAKRDFLFSYKGGCYQQLTQETCTAGNKIWFSSKNLQPLCSHTNPDCSRVPGNAPVLKCSQGRARDGAGMCSDVAAPMDYPSEEDEE